MQVLGFLAIIFGPIMEWIYRFIPNYGWALIVFTLLVNLVLRTMVLWKDENRTNSVSLKLSGINLVKPWCTLKQHSLLHN